MTRRIAGDLVSVEMLCPEGQPPATWRPSPEVVALYQRAKLIVVNGAEFETWVLNTPLPRSRVVRTADAIEDELLVVPGETHSHGPDGSHAHDKIAGHTWLDPINAIAQAGAIADALAAVFPEHAAAFDENHMSLAAELQNLHEQIAAIDTSTVGIIAPESWYGYLARRYDWPTGEIGDDPADWPTHLDASKLGLVLSTDARTVLLCKKLPGDAVAAALLESHGVRAVLWETGELIHDSSYTEVLTRNIVRLEAAIAELKP